MLKCKICGCQIVAQDRKRTYRPTKNVDGDKKNA